MSFEYFTRNDCVCVSFGFIYCTLNHKFTINIHLNSLNEKKRKTKWIILRKFHCSIECCWHYSYGWIFEWQTLITSLKNAYDTANYCAKRFSLNLLNSIDAIIKDRQQQNQQILYILWQLIFTVIAILTPFDKHLTGLEWPRTMHI